MSVSSSGCLFGNAILRVVVSSVAKSLSSMKTSAPVSRRRSEDLPDIGVADDRGVRHRRAFAILALRGARAAHCFQLALEPVDLQSDFPLVLLELAFAFALRADAAALLAEVTPRARQSRQRIFHARQIDLDARFARLRARAENIENDFLPVDHRHAGELLPVALLRRAQLIVENEHVALELLREIDDLLRLARADQIARMLFAMMHQHPLDDRNAERVDQFFQFLEQALRIRLLARVDVRADEKRALHHLVLCFDLKHPTANLARLFSRADCPGDPHGQIAVV